MTTQVVNHYNVQPLYDVYANVQDRDLGGVARDVDKVLDEFRPKLPAGSFFETRGQVGTMRTSFTGMAYGLLFAIVLVYFVMVVNFQSWMDPFIVLMAVPGALGRDSADAVFHPHHDECSRADGRYHEHWGRHGE